MGVGIAQCSDYALKWRMWVQFLVGAELFFSAVSSRSALNHTWTPIQWILEPPSLEQSGQGMKLAM
jgi:hypothetical protein